MTQNAGWGSPGQPGTRAHYFIAENGGWSLCGNWWLPFRHLVLEKRAILASDCRTCCAALRKRERENNLTADRNLVAVPGIAARGDSPWREAVLRALRESFGALLELEEHAAMSGWPPSEREALAERVDEVERVLIWAYAALQIESTEQESEGG